MVLLHYLNKTISASKRPGENYQAPGLSEFFSPLLSLFASPTFTLSRERLQERGDWERELGRVCEAPDTPNTSWLSKQKEQGLLRPFSLFSEASRLLCWIHTWAQQHTSVPSMFRPML